MICPHCGTALAPDARFCPACGKQTVSTESMLGPPPPGKTQEMVGREIAGRYRILTKLGEGGMGAVFKGEQISLKRQVAVKLLKPDLSANPQLLARFKIEAEAVAKLKHPNTVDIYDFGQDTDGTLFIAMEFIEGRSLRSAIHSEAPMPPRRALHIAAQVAASLADAHAHAIVHRDLKPDNVMLQERGRQRDIARVLDFGIAKLRDDSRATQQAMTQAGDMLGTPQYMAPEQIKGEAIDGRTDVYALGCMLYEMLTARLPFEATTIMAMLSKHLMEGVVAPSQRRPDLGLSPELDRLVLTAMMKQPQARPPTMEAYGEQLAAVLAQLPADPNVSASTPLSAVQPVITPPAHSAFVPSPTPPGPQSYGQPPAVPAVAVQSQFPPSQLPTLARTGAPPARRSKAPLWIALALVVLGGGGAAAYFLTRPQPEAKQEPEQPVKHDEPSPPPKEPDHKDPWSGADTPPVQDHPGGTIVDVTQGVRVVVPHGFTVAHQGPVMTAATQGYLIAAGPLISKFTDPNDIAREYATTSGLVFDGLRQAMFAGAMRAEAAFHGKAQGIQIAQEIVGYSGGGYHVVVTLTVPYARRNEAAVHRFATELFDKRVLLP